MNTDQQLIALAEFAGWRSVRQIGVQGERGFPYPGMWIGHSPEGPQFTLPDFLHDLNALQGLVNKLSLKQQEVFVTVLCEMFHGPEWLGSVINANAERRREAILRAIGKWTDPPPPAAPAFKSIPVTELTPTRSLLKAIAESATRNHLWGIAEDCDREIKRLEEL